MQSVACLRSWSIRCVTDGRKGLFGTPDEQAHVVAWRHHRETVGDPLAGSFPRRAENPGDFASSAGAAREIGDHERDLRVVRFGHGVLAIGKAQVIWPDIDA